MQWHTPHLPVLKLQDINNIVVHVLRYYLLWMFTVTPIIIVIKLLRARTKSTAPMWLFKQVYVWLYINMVGNVDVELMTMMHALSI